MSDALEVSITLDEVFLVVQTRRVPLAPELAGYLALEVAEGADPAGGDVEPKSVYIAEEGTVALVKPKRETTTGNADASIRAILARLLEASGSQTPALAAASRRKASGNLRALVEELEAALIPVNRAAGRRALARLAREVKRVTLGVGRNAHVPPSRGPSPSQPGAGSTSGTLGAPSDRAPSEVLPRLSPISSFPPEHSTARREVEPDLLRNATPAPPRLEPRPVELSSSELHMDSGPPSERNAGKSLSDVDGLLAQFEVSSQRGDHAVARELKEMVGLDPTPPPPNQATGDPAFAPLRTQTSRGLAPSLTEAGVEALLAMSEPVAPTAQKAAAVSPQEVPPAPERIHARVGGGAQARPVASPASRAKPADPLVAPPPSSQPGPRGISTVAVRTQRPNAVRVSTTGEFLPKKRGSERTLVAMVVTLVVVGGGAVAMLKLPPGFLTGRTPEKIAEEKAAAETARANAAAALQAASCRATLYVVDVPQNAEVLLREGQAPVDVAKMPVGARLEFVATAEGFAPKRTVVPAGAAWDPGPDGKARFEVAVQLDKTSRPKGDLWPAGEPGSEVGGKGPPGTVHIVSTPRAAEIWLLAGIGPEAKVEQLPCDTDVDVLVAGPTTFRKRVHVPASNFAPDTAAGNATPGRIGRVSAK